MMHKAQESKSGWWEKNQHQAKHCECIETHCSDVVARSWMVEREQQGSGALFLSASPLLAAKLDDQAPSRAALAKRAPTTLLRFHTERLQRFLLTTEQPSTSRHHV
jgi:hypothetical protein